MLTALCGRSRVEAKAERLIPCFQMTFLQKGRLLQDLMRGHQLIQALHLLIFANTNRFFFVCPLIHQDYITVLEQKEDLQSATLMHSLSGKIKTKPFFDLQELVHSMV